MKVIHCCIWGDICVSDLALSIIDTHHFQRLHYIKQTGLAYKVFPTATSSRFEHSIGVYHITKTFLQEIKNRQPELVLTPREIELLSISGLIHDIGHGPFSHVLDRFLCEYKKKDWPCHEIRSQILFRDLVEKYNIDLTTEEVEYVVRTIVSDHNQENWKNLLICNPISAFDMDKLDYILRDNYHFGMRMNVDITRILNNVKIIENRLCFCNRIFDEVHLLFFIRERLHRSIYRHRKIQYFESCLLEFLDTYLYWPDHFDLDFFLSLTDYFVLQSFPLQKWQEVETRKYKWNRDIDVPNHDTQWKKACENLWYYDRKNEKIFQIQSTDFVQFPFIHHH